MVGDAGDTEASLDGRSLLLGMLGVEGLGW